ncbi:MAG: hypothetical protein ACI4SM_01225 [Candidatus Gastranaerophilaceae bacterium]
MKVNSINVQTPISQVLKSNNVATVKTNMQIPSFDNNGNGSRAIASYFRGGQNVNFVGHACKKADFQVKKQENIPCACCGRPMMTSKQMNNFIDEAQNATGEDLIKVLDKTMPYFRGTEKAIANFFRKTAGMSPEKTMSELLMDYSPNAVTLLATEQKNVLATATQKATELFGEKNPLNDCIQRGIKLIDKSTNTNHFQRRKFLAEMITAGKSLKNREGVAEVIDLAAQLPNAGNSIESFIVKYSRKDNTAIARRLVNTAIATAEHVHPDSLGGPDHTSNYLGECGDCNSKRGNKPLEDWMKEYPNMPRNVQKNVDEVTERIINGDLGDKYDDYPIDIQATVERETNGMIKIKVKNPEEIDKTREQRGIAKPVKPTVKPENIKRTINI